MATSEEANLVLRNFACRECEELSVDDYFSCRNLHYFCGFCAEKSDYICNFDNCNQVVKVVANPLEKIVQNSSVDCKYKENGCSWHFKAVDMHNHLEECNFAPYKCVGKKLKIFSCSWEGIKKDAIEHFRECHSNFGKCFPFFHTSFFRLNFAKQITLKGFHVINAFNKDFCFCCESNPKTKEVNVMIYLMGRKATAKKYLLSFEIYTTENNFKKVTFVQQILSDADDAEDIKSNCINVSYNILQQFVVDDKLNYRLRIVKKEFKPRTESGSSENDENKFLKNKDKKSDKPKKLNNPFLKG